MKSSATSFCPKTVQAKLELVQILNLILVFIVDGHTSTRVYGESGVASFLLYYYNKFCECLTLCAKFVIAYGNVCKVFAKLYGYFVASACTWNFVCNPTVWASL